MRYEPRPESLPPDEDDEEELLGDEDEELPDIEPEDKLCQ
jgi:hypothetical protein